MLFASRNPPTYALSSAGCALLAGRSGEHADATGAYLPYGGCNGGCKHYVALGPVDWAEWNAIETVSSNE